MCSPVEVIIIIITNAEFSQYVFVLWERKSCFCLHTVTVLYVNGKITKTPQKKDPDGPLIVMHHLSINTYTQWQSVECQTLFCSYNEYLIFKFGFSIHFVHKLPYARICLLMGFCTCHSPFARTISPSLFPEHNGEQMC